MPSPPRDELVIEVLSALRVPGVSVHEVIKAHRRYVGELMQQWARLEDDEAEFDLTVALVVDAEIFRFDSLVPWLDTAEGCLTRAETEPPGETAGPLIRRRLVARRCANSSSATRRRAPAPERSSQRSAAGSRRSDGARATRQSAGSGRSAACRQSTSPSSCSECPRSRRRATCGSRAGIRQRSRAGRSSDPLPPCGAPSRARVRLRRRRPEPLSVRGPGGPAGPSGPGYRRWTRCTALVPVR